MCEKEITCSVKLMLQKQI